MNSTVRAYWGVYISTSGFIIYYHKCVITITSIWLFTFLSSLSPLTRKGKNLHLIFHWQKNSSLKIIIFFFCRERGYYCSSNLAAISYATRWVALIIIIKMLTGKNAHIYFFEVIHSSTKVYVWMEDIAPYSKLDSTEWTYVFPHPLYNGNLPKNIISFLGIARNFLLCILHYILEHESDTKFSVPFQLVSVLYLLQYAASRKKVHSIISCKDKCHLWYGWKVNLNI